MKAVVFSEATHDFMLHSLPGQNFSSQVVWSPGVLRRMKCVVDMIGQKQIGE
jgi:hypothetical protein